MSEPLTLRAMTWSDPRGYDPVVAAATAFTAIEPHVSIIWDKRSLQGFESTPVDELAQAYDLMVIDHPHVGAAQSQGCLLPLNTHAPTGALDQLANETVGKSFASYTKDGAQWALPIDAAAQVQAIRSDLIPGPVTQFAEVLDLALQGRVIWPLRPPHNLMSFYTLAANRGTPCNITKGPLIDQDDGLAILDSLQGLANAVDPSCFQMDPIAALDALASGSKHALIPLTYFYALYGHEGYKSHRLSFHDIPAFGSNGPLGSALGGTGIAISARTDQPDLCTRFALWLASAEVQRGLYAANNGQPGNARAWGDPVVNAAAGSGYANTRMTHEAAWLRPRHNGYMRFQHSGAEILNEALQGKISHASALKALDLGFIESFSNDL